MPEVYPVTILPARYSGVYEGASWVAFACDPEFVPANAFGDDLEAAEWWAQHGHTVGRGDSPDEALGDLTALQPEDRWPAARDSYSLPVEPSHEAVAAADEELESLQRGRSDREITLDALRAAYRIDGRRNA